LPGRYTSSSIDYDILFSLDEEDTDQMTKKELPVMIWFMKRAMSGV
jgi:hypothetical protein